MKPNPLRSIATHLAGVAAGGALAYVLVAAPAQDEEAPPPKHRSTTLAARFSPTVTLELERLMEDINAERLAAHQDSALTIRERNLRAIEKQPQIDRENDKELVRLRAIAGTFVEIKDLRPTLTNALATGDTDLSRAIFLEWHRRDPAAAFDALAERGAWIEAFDDILALAVPNDQIIAQLDRGDRSGAFQSHLATRLGVKLAKTDDLRGVAQALKSTGPWHDNMFRGFTNHWIPDDGKEAARFIGLEMRPEHQRQFLNALAGRDANLNPQPWTDQFANALFEYDLHVPQETFEQLAESVERSKRPPYVRSPESTDDFLDGPLHHQRDYPELFAAGLITLDEIASSIREAMPGVDQDPEALSRALFLKLAEHNPARAVTWANSTIPRRHLDEDITSILERAVSPDTTHNVSNEGNANIWTEGYEPRTRRLAELTAVLQPSGRPASPPGFFPSAARLRFEEWSRLAPDQAARTLDHIAPDHPVWKGHKPSTAGP